MRCRLPAVAVVACCAIGAGCSVPMKTVPVSASHVQWEALAGEWHGTYQMDGYHRHGTIAFKLVAVEEQASGEVLMIPESRGWPYTGNQANGVPPQQTGLRTELLTIRFAEAVQGTIQGTMDPYWDPDRRCTARASFSGAVQGDRMSGTVTSTCVGGIGTLRGRWRAQRNPAAATSK